MKKFTLLFILNLSFLIFNAQKVKAQNVYIPDANFKAALVSNSSINTNGDSQIQLSEASNFTGDIFVEFSNISDLTGIEAFTSVVTLSCNGNQLTSLNVTTNTALERLYCSANQLSSLNISSNLDLYYLDCSHNILTNLDVSTNTALNYLICVGNQFSSIDVSANTALTNLDCSYNQLTSLNVSFNLALTQLNCSYNQLTNLDVSANTALTVLGCAGNQLTSLNFSANVALENLTCFFNQLTSLNVSFNPALEYLDCSWNQLPNLNILANTALITLKCFNNQLTSLNVSANTALYTLECSYNQLTSLDLSANNVLLALICDHNQLTAISQVPNSMQRFWIHYNNISCLYNLPQVSNASYGNIIANPLTCVPNQTSYILGLPICTDNDPINNPNNCQSVANIVGNVYTDLNGNCTYNNTDWKTQSIPVRLYDNQNNFIALSYTINSLYGFSTLPVDTYVVKINDVLLPIEMSCGQANTTAVNLSSATQSLMNNDFAVVCDSLFTSDISVHSITRQGWVFPGQIHTLQTNVTNNSNWFNLNCTSIAVSGTVSIQVNGLVSFVAPTTDALTPSVNGNNFTYTIADFNSLTPSSFGLQLLTDTTSQAGNKICVHVTISPDTPDLDTTNNEYDFCYQVVNSYDPNMKEVYPTNVLPGYDDWFTYTIHFQNTGTAPAFNIRLRDTLDTQLDINTFEFLGASHTANTSLNGNILTVRFNNIMLPDSTSDYEGSMGYYQYRVKPLPNITNGSTIENTAYIYFDYNPAIITNTTQNNFDITVGNRVIEKNEVISIYPNPSTGIFTIKSAGTIKIIEVFNLIGESLLQQTNGNTININNQPQGIYFCKVNGNSVVKLVKE